MSINRGDILRGILIGSSIFLCSSILIVTLYFLYHYRKNLIAKQKTEESKRDNFHFDQIQKIEEEPIDPLKNESRPTIIEELMRKSLQLAKTVEKVADEKEKRISVKDKIHIDLQL